jgi:MoaA/NifB/PqqE/SkfB family radical SAM enzyme
MRLPSVVRKALNLTSDLFRKTTATRGYPQIFGVETTASCNAACPFCPLHGPDAAMHRKKGVMDMQLFEKVLEQLVEHRNRLGVVFLNVCGEPLLDPQVTRRLKLIGEADMGEFVNMQTNGQLLTQEYGEAILAARIDKVTLGFDGSSREVYEQHRVRCSYDRVLENTRRFLAARDQLRSDTRLVVKYVLTRENRHEEESARALWAQYLSLKKDRFVVTPSENWATACIDQGGQVLKTAGPPGGRLRHCPLLFYTMNILYDGSVPACCWDYNLDVAGGALGDANNDSLLEIWRGEAFEKLRERHRAGDFAGLERCKLCSVIQEPA